MFNCKLSPFLLKKKKKKTAQEFVEAYNFRYLDGISTSTVILDGHFALTRPIITG